MLRQSQQTLGISTTSSFFLPTKSMSDAEIIDGMQPKAKTAEAKVEKAKQEMEKAEQKMEKAEREIEKAKQEVEKVKQEVEKAIEKLELLEAKLETLLNTETIGPKVERVRKDLCNARDTLDMRKHMLSLALKEKALAIEKESAAMEEKALFLDGLKIVQEECRTYVQCLLQLHNTAYKSEKSHIGLDLLSNMLYSEPLKVSDGPCIKRDLTMNNVFFSENGSFVGVEQDDAAPRVAKFFHNKIVDVINEYRDRVHFQQSGGASQPSEQSLQLAELSGALQKLRIDGALEEGRKARDTDESKMLKDVGEVVNELVEAHRPSSFVEPEEAEALGNYFEGYLRYLNKFKESTCLLPRTEYDWCHVHYSSMLTKGAHLTACSKRSAMSAGDAHCSGDALWDCLCPIELDGNRTRVKFEVRPDLAILFTIRQGKIMIGQIITLLAEYKNHRCVNDNDREVWKGLLTALASMRIIELVLKYAEKNEEEVAIPYINAAGTSVKVFLLCRNTQKCQQERDYNVYLLYEKSFGEDKSVDYKALGEVLVVLWKLLGITMEQKYFAALSEVSKNLREALSELQQEKKRYLSKRSARKTKSNISGSRSRSRSEGGANTRGRALSERTAYHCVLACKMRDSLYPDGVHTLFPSGESFITKGSVRSVESSDESDVAMAQVFVARCPLSLWTTKRETVAPRMFCASRKVIIKVSASSCCMNEVHVLEHLMKEANENGVDLFFPRLLDHEWRSTESVAVLALEYVGGTVTVMKSIAELLLTIGDLLKAVRSMHMDAKVIHGDIKPGNICCDDLGRLRFIDFEFASIVDDYDARLPSKGYTRKFAAPEVIQEGVTCGCKSDMYSVGATIKSWTEGLGDVSLLNESEGTYQEVLVKVRHLVGAMTINEEERRPSADEALLLWKEQVRSLLDAGVLSANEIPTSPIG